MSGLRDLLNRIRTETSPSQILVKPKNRQQAILLPTPPTQSSKQPFARRRKIGTKPPILRLPSINKPTFDKGDVITYSTDYKLILIQTSIFNELNELNDYKYRIM